MSVRLNDLIRNNALLLLLVFLSVSCLFLDSLVFADTIIMNDDVFKIKMILDNDPLMYVERGINTYVNIIPETAQEGIQKVLIDNFVFDLEVIDTISMQAQPQENVLHGAHFVFDINLKKNMLSSDIEDEDTKN